MAPSTCAQIDCLYFVQGRESVTHSLDDLAVIRDGADLGQFENAHGEAEVHSITQQEHHYKEVL